MSSRELSANMSANVNKEALHHKGNSVCAGEKKMADTDVRVPFISKIAYGMGTWAVISVGCLLEIF